MRWESSPLRNALKSLWVPKFELIVSCFVFISFQFLQDVLDALFNILMQNSDSDVYDNLVLDALVSAGFSVRKTT